MKILERLFKKTPLSFDEAQSFFASLDRGELSAEVVSAALALIHFRGEEAEELSGWAHFALEHLSYDLHDLNRLKSKLKAEVLDICGTGGDGFKTFNISTTAAFVLASLGLKVAKHGNRAVSSLSGSSDVMEELGLSLDLSLKEIQLGLEKLNFTYLHAPYFHPVFKKLVSVRKALKIRTSLNLLGPLINPLQPEFQVVGVCSRDEISPLIFALKRLGKKGALVVCDEGGLDEFSSVSHSFYARLFQDEVTFHELSPKDLKIQSHEGRKALLGGSPRQNAEITLSILAGEKSARADTVALNVSAGLLASHRVNSLQEGFALAQSQLKSGKALSYFQKIKKNSQNTHKSHPYAPKV